MRRRSVSPAAPQLVAQPFLDYAFPTNAGTVDALRERNTFAHSVIAPLFTLHERIGRNRTDDAQRAEIDAFLTRFFGTVQAGDHMRAALTRARALLMNGLDPYVPDDRRKVLGLLDDDALVSLDEVLRDMFARGQSSDAVRRAFVARRRYFLARYLLHLDRSDAAIERSTMLKQQAHAALHDDFLIPATEEATVFCSNHDPANEDRCLDVRTTSQPQWTHQRSALVHLQQFRCLQEKTRPVLVQIRMKDPFAILIRMLRDELPHPEHVPDLRGIRFICFSHDDRRACLDALLERFPIVASTADDWVDLYAGTAVRRLNRFSSRYFRVLKFAAEFAGALWEFQIMHAKDFTNLWYSTGEENWYRYRLRQLVALFFPRFFPRRIYGIRWGKPSTYASFAAWISREPRRFPITISH